MRLGQAPVIKSDRSDGGALEMSKTGSGVCTPAELSDLSVDGRTVGQATLHFGSCHSLHYRYSGLKQARAAALTTGVQVTCPGPAVSRGGTTCKGVR